ncbi:MAG: HAMP domain-containing protein [Candidatus Marinimicrobia bacterium]|nr:HAMP domain-containing protein [Candidatus Neomarinimicrobiota bacterium]MCF7829312.1 HAMP domain-containing protein [Candidatus Neomarinimicrobiota bacterium]MCF7880026.1 HAMP domain-containing protein [Candidatus Neomarinimicrobiota bacterium]
MKWFKQDPLSKVPIKYKLPLTFVLLCLVAFGIGGYLVANSVYHSMEAEIQNRLRSEAYAQATVLDKKFETLSRRAEDFASDGYIRTHIEGLLAKSTAAEKEALYTHLRNNKLPLEDAFIGLAILGRNGNPLVRAGSTNHELPANFPAKNVSEETRIVSLGNGSKFAIITPLWNINHTETLGSLLSVVKTDAILQTTAAEFNSAVRKSQGERYLTLFDRRDGALQIPWVTLNLDDLQPLSSAAGAARYSQHLGHHACQHGQTMFGQSYPLQNTDWNVLIELNATPAFTSINSLEGKFLGAGILIALTTLVLLYFPVRFVIQPLDALKNMALRIKDGDFSVRLENDSEDEIGHLARTFNHMAQAVEERTTNLEQTAKDLRQREEELRLEHQRLDTLVHSMQDGLVLLNKSGEIVLSNRAAKPIIGIIEQDISEFRTSQCRENGSAQDCIQCLRRKFGSHTCILRTEKGVFEVLSTQLPGLNDEVGKVLVARDITERERMRERQSHQERLTVLGKISAVVAHELNSPLAAISMYNQMMQGELSDDSPYREHTEVIQRNTQSCQKIIKELLDYARTPQPEIEEVDLKQVVQDVLRFLKPVYERKEVRFDIEAEIPQVTLDGDKVQLQQVVVNLVMNAIQALPEEDGHIRITIEDHDEGYILYVSDNGSGIPDECIDEIFEPFFTTKSSGGTGLGLPTARRIVKAHGGTLTLMETGESGTTFRVQLPSQAASNPEPPRDGKSFGEKAIFDTMSGEENHVQTAVN